MLKLLFVAVAAYCLGMVPTAYLLVKFFYGRDIRHMGSRNVGAMNVASNISLGMGSLTLLLDMLKGLLAVLMARYLVGSMLASMVAAWLVVAGDIWPLPWGSRGGKGLAAGLGALFGLKLGLGFWVVVALGLGLLVTRESNLAVVVAFLFMPFLAWWQLGKLIWLFIGIILALPILAKHLRVSRFP